jgi:hypothetical protein
MSTSARSTHTRPLRRPAWLLGALAMAIAPGLLLPSTAAARQRRERCTVELNVASSELTAGESATLDGSLMCPESLNAAEQTVTIYQHVAGTPGYSAIGSASTEPDGAYRFTTEALEGNGAFYASAGNARSRRSEVKVTPLLTLSAPPDGTALLLAGRRAGAAGVADNTVTFSGTVSPDDGGATVVLQRENAAANEGWRRIGIAAVDADGTYSISHTFALAGEATIRAVVRVRGLTATVSEPVSYEIAQRQNPKLTIHASAQPLSYGQSVTLSGSAAGAAHESLTLLARSVNGSFAAVATATTDASGNYEFPAQSRLQSTYYRVTSAHASSTSLFEGFEPLLTAHVSAVVVQEGRPMDAAEASSNAVPAGEPLTFSGSITPGRAGQVVYLERQNPSGIGFHIVAAGTVSSESTYSIDHAVSGTGTQVFRIKLPRDEENQATASEPFKIQVTPAPAASQEPVAPGAGTGTGTGTGEEPQSVPTGG